MTYKRAHIDLPQENLRDHTQIFWMRKEGDGYHLGLAKMVPDGNEAPSHRLSPALERLYHIETEASAQGGLELLREWTPYFVHGMGYYRDWGARESCVIGGRATEQRLKYFIRGLLREQPDMELFVHCFGEEVDLELVRRFIPPADYQDALSQARVRGRVLPAQARNVQALISTEEKFLGQEESVRLLNMNRYPYWYKKEEDRGAYFVFADWEFFGFNNARAIPGYIREIQKRDSHSLILVHRLGSELDFTLAERLGKLPVPREEDFS